jgi:hypothetical protein
MIIFNFDVLAQAGTDLPQRVPNPEGLKMWNMCSEASMGRIGVVVNGSPNQEQFEHWLKVYNIKASLYEVLETDDPVIKGEKIERLMATFGKMDWYIDVDPATVRETLSRGITAWMMTSPYVIRPEWERPESAPTPWSQLVGEIEKQQIAKMEKDWRKKQE